MRTFIIVLIDDYANSTRKLLKTATYRDVLDYMESEMAARDGRPGRNRRPLVSAVIRDTFDGKLSHYVIDGLRAVLVTPDLFHNR